MMITYEDFKTICTNHKYAKEFTIDMGDNYIAHYINDSYYIGTDQMTYRVDIYLGGKKVAHCPWCVTFCRDNKIVPAVLGCFCNTMDTINRHKNLLIK